MTDARQDHLESDERELVALARSGDRIAFREIYDRYRDRAYHLIFYSLNERLLAEDILQTVFLKIYRGLPDFRGESSLATWIYRIALNECLNQNRRRSPEHIPLESILGSGEDINTALAPDDAHARNELQRIVQQTVFDLPPKLRSVVVLKYIEELSYDEIAQVLECSTGTVASRLNRALTEMESRLQPLRRLL